MLLLALCLMFDPGPVPLKVEIAAVRVNAYMAYHHPGRRAFYRARTLRAARCLHNAALVNACGRTDKDAEVTMHRIFKACDKIDRGAGKLEE